MTIAIDDVLVDHIAEYERLEGILRGLTEAQWASPSGAPGWTVTAVVVHLAQTEEEVAATLQQPSDEWHVRDRPLDHAVDDRVLAEVAAPSLVLERWAAACRASVDALHRADPTCAYRWAAAPLRPRTLATTRLAEHWAHGLDVTDPLAIRFDDTDRLRHIAWLGHATLPYAMRLHGIEPADVRVELEAPSGDRWCFGPPDAPDRITGAIGAFCRVGAQRVRPEDSGLEVSGLGAADALRVLRNDAA